MQMPVTESSAAGGHNDGGRVPVEFKARPSWYRILGTFFLDSFNVSFELFSVFFLLLFLYLLYQGCGWVFVFIFFFIVFLAVINRGINTFFFLSLYSAQGKCWIRSRRARAIHDWSRLYLEVASVTITAMLLVMINVWCLDKVKV